MICLQTTRAKRWMLKMQTLGVSGVVEYPILACLFESWLLCFPSSSCYCTFRKADKDDLGTCVPCHHLGNSDKVPGTWLWFVPVLAVVVFWGSEPDARRYSLPICVTICYLAWRGKTTSYLSFQPSGMKYRNISHRRTQYCYLNGKHSLLVLQRTIPVSGRWWSIL